MSKYISFGTWQLPPENTAQIIRDAVEAGFKHIDTAAAYANEAAVGDAVAACGAAREDLYISGKLWTSRRGHDAAIKACKKSLRNLRLEYFDQYLIHWPATEAAYASWREINGETWGGIAELKNEGLARRIGVCNFTPVELKALIDDTGIAPEVNQIEFHPGLLQKETFDFCKSHGIEIEAWSALGHGTLLQNPTLAAIAEKTGKTTAQVVLRWCLQKGANPVTKTVNPARMRSNLDVFGFTLDSADVSAIDSVVGGETVDYDTFLKRS